MWGNHHSELLGGAVTHVYRKSRSSQRLHFILTTVENAPLTAVLSKGFCILYPLHVYERKPNAAFIAGVE